MNPNNGPWEKGATALGDALRDAGATLIVRPGADLVLTVSNMAAPPESIVSLETLVIFRLRAVAAGLLAWLTWRNARGA